MMKKTQRQVKVQKQETMEKGQRLAVDALFCKSIDEKLAYIARLVPMRVPPKHRHHNAWDSMCAVWMQVRRQVHCGSQHLKIPLSCSYSSQGSRGVASENRCLSFYSDRNNAS